MTKPEPDGFSITLDRIEGEVAVLLCGEDPVYEWHLPRKWLPPDAKEGEQLRVQLTRDTAATETTKTRNAALFAALLQPEDPPAEQK